MAGKRLKQLLRLYGLYAKMDLAWLMRDTKFFLLAVIADFLSNIAAVTGVFLLAWRFNGVGSMDKFEVLFMLGYVTTCTGIFQTFFANSNTGHISRRIGRGQMEHMLIQPLPLPIQLITEGFIPVSGSSNMIAGAIIIGVAVKNLGLQPGLGWFGLLLLHLSTTILILLSLSYLFSSAAFYAPVQAEEISSHVLDSTGILSSYPLSGMTLAIQIPLITIIPAGLLGWFPTLALIGKPPLGFPSFYPMLMAALLYILAYIAFTKGLKHYVKTGTNRYSAVGHRR